jgi:hypothetical protein
MIDVITYCPDIEALRAELLASNSPYVDEEGRFNVPMTPVRYNGSESIALLRVTDLALVEAVNGLTVLASAPSGGTSAFMALFRDPEATAIYDRVYDQTPVTYVDESGEEYTATPPRIFGVFA